MGNNGLLNDYSVLSKLSAVEQRDASDLKKACGSPCTTKTQNITTYDFLPQNYLRLLQTVRTIDSFLTLIV